MAASTENSSSNESNNNLSYAQELELRIDQLIDWAIANQPHTLTKLSKTDFSEAREKFSTVAKGGGKLLTQEPEPEDGGAQYINDNPAPWP